MKTPSFKYPNRADLLALFRARERNLAPPASATVAPASRADAPVCLALPAPQSR